MSNKLMDWEDLQQGLSTDEDYQQVKSEIVFNALPLHQRFAWLKQLGWSDAEAVAHLRAFFN